MKKNKKFFEKNKQIEKVMYNNCKDQRPYGNYIINDNIVKNSDSTWKDINFKKKKMKELHKIISYMGKVLIFSKYFENYYIYSVSYLFGNNIYVISYNDTKLENIENNCFKLLNKYVNFKLNDRIFFRKLINFDKKISNNIKYLLIKTDYYRCLSALLLSLNEHRLNKYIIHEYLDSVICKINKEYIVNKINCQFHVIIDIINKDLNSKLPYSCKINEIIEYIYYYLIKINNVYLNLSLSLQEEFYYKKKFNTIVGIWLDGDYNLPELYNSYKKFMCKV